MDLKKLQKKLKRKETLFLAKEPGLVEFQKEPSPFVLVHNGGIANGLSRAVIQCLLPACRYILMPVSKDFCYLTFTSAREAEEEVQASNGMCVQGAGEVWDLLPVSLKDGPPLHLFLSYIANIPCQDGGRENDQCKYSPTISSSLACIPPGLVILQEFVSEREEQELLSWLKEEYSSERGSGDTLRHRQVRHYGYKFDYSSNSVDHTQPLPGAMPTRILDLIDRIMATNQVGHVLDQVTVNLYPPGAGELPWRQCGRMISIR